MTSLADLFKSFKKEIKKSTGTDYTATVTRVENGMAYVQITGSPISDTPAIMSVDARPGDRVRVRVQNGKAWVMGNDTLPPSNDKKEVATKMSQDMSDRNKHIVIRDGVIKFVGDTLVVESKNFKLNEDGDATFSGKLQAAEGEFLGTLTFDWAEDNPGMHTKIKVGSDQTSPIIVESVNGDESTGIYSDMISIAANGGMTWAQMDIYDGFQWSSDRRVKCDIEKLEGSDLALKLNPISYRFTSDPSGKMHYGFIAQEVQKLMPDAVTKNKDGYLGLNYMEFIAPAIAMIQKQENRIASLEAEIKALKEKK